MAVRLDLAHKHYLAGLIWCALLGALWWVMDRQLQPKVAQAGTAGEVVIPRSPDGHFYVNGTINGQALTFLVDTGATTVAVNRRVAARLGLLAAGLDSRPVSVNTANGAVQALELRGLTIALGDLRVRDARVLVLADMAVDGLLGQNVLRHLDVSAGEGRMVLRRRAE